MGCIRAAHCHRGPAVRRRSLTLTGPSGPWACPDGRSGSDGWLRSPVALTSAFTVTCASPAAFLWCARRGYPT